MPRRALALVIAVVASAAIPTRTAQDQPGRGFRSEVNYVRVDMYPTSGGRPVTDLQQSEVEVLEDGVTQEVAQFEHVFIAGSRTQTRREPSTIAGMRQATQDPRARVFVLFLDPRHVDVQGSMNVRRPLIDTLNSLIGGDDLIAIMTPEMSARDLTFTRRLGSIEQMLTPHWGQEEWIGTRDLKEIQYEACYDNPVSIPGGPEIARAMIARHREVLVLDALDSLIEYLGGLREERKAVITISDGWPLYGPDQRLTKALQAACSTPCNVEVPIPKIGFDPRTKRPTLDAPSSATSITSDGGTIDRAKCETDRVTLAAIHNERRFIELMQGANRANVSFYPVGPGGFSAAYRPLTARNRSLQMMADITDGRAITQPASMETGLRRIVDDLSSYYLLGYYSNAKPDGRFHRITVRVKRPDVQVRARSGYLAASPAEAAARVSSSVSSPDTAEAQLVSRALNPLAALGTERPVRVQAAMSSTPAGTAVIRAVAEVSRATARGGDDWSQGAQIDAVLLDKSGDTVANGRASIAPGTFVGQLTLSPRASLAPGDYELRIRAKGVDVVSPGIEDLRITIPAAPAGAGVLFMRRGPGTGNREVPTADARFRRTERLIVEVPASQAAGAVSARLLDRFGNALPIPTPTTIREDVDGSRWRRIEVVLAPLAQGDYLIESTQGRERTLTGFRVVP